MSYAKIKPWSWWRRVQFQRRGPILDIWRAGKPMVVVCKHLKTWRQGGIGCQPCLKEWHIERRRDRP